MTRAGIPTLTREELYDLVWSKPTTQLAVDFGVSDVAIAKACRRYKIPKPPLGYWAKIQHGQKLQRPALPPLTKPHPKVITFQGGPPKPAPSTDEAKEKIIHEARQENQITVSDSLRSCHPLVARTRDSLRDAYTDEYGRVRPRGAGCLNLCVSKGSASRALRIWNALIKSSLERGYSVDVAEESGRYATRGVWHTQITILGEPIELRMEEPAKRSDHVPTDKEKKSGYWKKWEFAPSGQLNFIVESYAGDGHKRNWSDSDRNPIEKRLNDGAVKNSVSNEIYLVNQLRNSVFQSIGLIAHVFEFCKFRAVHGYLPPPHLKA